MFQNENTVLSPTQTKGIVEHYFDVVKKNLLVSMLNFKLNKNYSIYQVK